MWKHEVKNLIVIRTITPCMLEEVSDLFSKITDAYKQDNTKNSKKLS